MPTVGFVLVAISGFALAVMSVQQQRREPNGVRLIVHLLAITIYFWVIFAFFGLPRRIEPMGGSDDGEKKFLATVVALYVCIVFGMLAEFFYTLLDKPKRNRVRNIDIAAMVKPVFISPLVLIPTVAAFQNSRIDLMNLDFPKLMILLTAFEKGFLWQRMYRLRAWESGKEVSK